MVVQDHSYPLGHRITGEYWYDLRENDLHFTLADTGWAKSAWGKFFGPWICGACNFVYDIRTKFNPTEIIPPAREVRDHHLLCSTNDLQDAHPG